MIEFIGKFHPLLVHLPIGFLVLLGIFEMLARQPQRQHLTDTSRVVLVITFPVTLATIICGWLLAGNGDYDGANLFWHRWLGTGFGAATLLLLALHWSGMFRLYRWALTVTLALLVVASHFGGTLTHGSEYLYWPGKKSSSIPSFTGNIAAQPVYPTVIQPIFNKHCVGCHGPDKAKGGLRLHTAEALATESDSGSAIDPPGATENLLGKRLNLPLEHEDHMPPKGKPQLTKDQLAIIRWWLDAGAPTDKTIQELNPTPEILRTSEALASSQTHHAPQ